MAVSRLSDMNKGASMAENNLLDDVCRTISTGLALLDREDWSICYENAQFFQWFPPTGDPDESMKDRVEGFRSDRALTRLQRNRPYQFEVETKVGNKPIPVQIEIKPLSDDPEALLLVECRNISKEKEAAYMLESYSKMAERNARELQKEKDRVEKLLLNVMPKSVYEEIKDYGTTTPQRFENASVMMLDFVDFTEMTIARDPSALIAELNDMFSSFDRISELFDCERIKTIGDAYMAVSGIPDASPDHAMNIARVALRIRRYLEKRNAAHHEDWHCRIGINTGPVIGSIVGIQKYVYDIFGPGVNLAARMESESAPMGITLCDEMYPLIKDDFNCTECGEIEIKGFGRKTLYTLDGEVGR